MKHSLCVGHAVCSTLCRCPLFNPECVSTARCVQSVYPKPQGAPAEAQHALIDVSVVVQSGVAQSYAGLVPPLVYLADDMVRDVDPQVCLGLRSTLLLATVQTFFLLARTLLHKLLG